MAAKRRPFQAAPLPPHNQISREIPGLPIFKPNSGLTFPVSGIERTVGTAELLLKCICG
jgi:hypothetical protein